MLLNSNVRRTVQNRHRSEATCCADSALCYNRPVWMCAGCRGCRAECMAAGVDDDTWRQDPDTDVVLSDVHIGAAPSTAQLCTTLFCFTDGWRIGRASCSGNTCNRGSNGSSASRTSSGRAASAQLANHDDGDGRGGPTRAAVAAAPMQTDEDGDVIVKRRRTGADARSSSSSRQPCITGGSNSDDGASDGIVVHHAMATSLRDVGKQASDVRLHVTARRPGPDTS